MARKREERISVAKDTFFEKMAAQEISLTYDDVRLKTGHSTVMPDEVSTESSFSVNVPLKTPIVSAAMDTVTEHQMAIEIAKMGGLGIIHRNLTPEAQAHQVARVKRYLNGLIVTPECVHDGQEVGEILKIREQKSWEFNSFPVLNKDDQLVGILTGNDFDFCDNPAKTAREIMTVNPVTAPPGTTINDAYRLMAKNKIKSLPIVDYNGHVKGLYIFSDVKRVKSGSSSKYNIDESGQLRVGAAVGVGSDISARVPKLLEQHVDVVVIDTAHGDSAKVLEAIKEIKGNWPDLDVVAGNISEPESARRLIEAGADGIKVGQGPGSICTTRVIAGIGRPQVTAVYECSRVADEYGVPVCADGGITHSGDIPVAIGAGAHSVMLGNLFAATKEAPGEIVFLDEKRWKQYRGMGSMGAMEASKAARERYGQSETGKNGIIPEGVEGLVPYRGSAVDMLVQLEGGLRRGMGYVGAATIEELRQKATFLRSTPAGLAESHPHDIVITREPPNYTSKRP